MVALCARGQSERGSALRAENYRERRARKLRAGVGAAERIHAARRAACLSRRRAGVSEVIQPQREALPSPPAVEAPKTSATAENNSPSLRQT